ncbi:MAG TPA: hypothetical protein VFS17_02355 [Methylophilaceae bacterium]|nr:hypothetical protein [Methylophilaceae bacterium]
MATVFLNKLRFNWSAWHRRLGLVTCLGVVLWGISGMCHPIMSRLQPKPAEFSAPAAHLDLTSAMSPQQVLACHQITQFRRLNVVAVDSKAVYRVVTDSNAPARYYAAADCKELAAGDEYYAREFASHFTGRPMSEITSAHFLTQFDDEYLFVNRLLPVWRIEFAGPDHLRAYIDTDQARLATLIDGRRMALGQIFRFGHNWAFLDGLPRLQLAVMAVVLGVALFSAVSGLTLYVRRRRHSRERLAGQPLRRWHRRVGLLVSLTTLTFVGSGLFHLVMSYSQQQEKPIHPSDAAISAASLDERAWQHVAHHPASRIDLVASPAGVQWLLRHDMPQSKVAMLAHAEHAMPAMQSAAVLLPAGKELVTPTDILALAKSQASAYAGLPEAKIVDSELVTRFGGEYGFIFKRLPVVKVVFDAPGHPRYYIEPATGALAARLNDSDAVEGWTFAYVHKWAWLDAHKDLRDILVMLFALGNIVIALLGVWLFARMDTRH